MTLRTQASIGAELQKLYAMKRTEADVKRMLAYIKSLPPISEVADALTPKQEAMMAALPDLARPPRVIAADGELTPAQKAAELEAKQKADDAETEAKISSDQLTAFMKSVGDWQKSVDAKLDAMTSKAQDVANKEPGAVSEETKVGEPDKVDEMADSAFVDGLGALGRHEAARAVRAALSKAQAQADAVYGGFGLRAEAPMMGERIVAYRTRLVRALQRFSPTFKEVDLDKIRDRGSFEAIEKQVYADASVASRTPEVAEGELLEVKRPDGTGRVITEFYGDPKSWMRDFQSPKMIVTGIRNQSN